MHVFKCGNSASVLLRLPSTRHGSHLGDTFLREPEYRPNRVVKQIMVKAPDAAHTPSKCTALTI